VVQKSISEDSHRRLLFALEKARSQLAVTIAAESKSTPLQQWRCYLDIADQVRRFIKELRKTDLCERPNPRDLDRVFHALDKISIKDSARRLSRTLSKIMEDLE
jgi:hypothetical protein